MLGVLALFLSVSLAACTEPGPPEPNDELGDLPPGDVARGEMMVELGMCKSCHANDLAGSPEPIPGSSIYSSNITPDDATGIGLWTDKALDEAMRLGKDDSGMAVCSPMPVYEQMSAQDSADIIAYLRSVPPVNREVEESSCR